jgi:hypothetical protein
MNAPAKVTKPKGETVENVLDEMDKRTAENLRIWKLLSKTDPKHTKQLLTSRRVQGNGNQANLDHAASDRVVRPVR